MIELEPVMLDAISVECVVISLNQCKLLSNHAGYDVGGIVESKQRLNKNRS